MSWPATLQARAGPVGWVETSGVEKGLPNRSNLVTSAKQRWVDGHDTEPIRPLSWSIPLTVCQAELCPSGSVLHTTLPTGKTSGAPPGVVEAPGRARTHRCEDGHETP